MGRAQRGRLIGGGEGLEGLRRDSAFARQTAERLTKEFFELADVGCSGGIDKGWRAFGARLRAIGFDCSGPEIERLTTAESHPGVRYVEGLVGLPHGHPLLKKTGGKSPLHRWPPWRLSYQRTTLLREAAASGAPAPALRDHFAQRVWAQTWDGTPPTGFDTDYSVPEAGEAPGGDERTILLEAALREMDLKDPDFLKIDVDGGDYDILRSAVALLDQPGLLGVGIEVNFVGSHDANDNSFHNVDRLMRSKGFDLFALTTRLYGSAALPWPYRYKEPGVTAGGRPVQGDALYLRDLSSPMRRSDAASVSDEKLAKLAAIFALVDLPDEAAEMLLVHEQRLGSVINIPQGLDLLALQIQENDGTDLSYDEYIAAFEGDATQFLDQDGRRAVWIADLKRLAGQ